MATSEQVHFMSDGTNIEYSVTGNGPGLLMIHGERSSAIFEMSRLNDLAQQFTIYIIERRGWGYSGSKGSDYTIQKDCEDAISILVDYDIQYIYGEDFGAIVALHIAREYPVKKMILYEPYLVSFRNLDWLPRMNCEVSKGDYLSAFVSYFKSYKGARFFPRFFLKFLFKDLMTDYGKQELARFIEYCDPEFQERREKDIEADDWKMVKKILQMLPIETKVAQVAENELIKLNSVSTRALLIYNEESEQYIYKSVAKISEIIPDCKNVVCKVNEMNTVFTPQPDDVFKWITQFITEV